MSKPNEWRDAMVGRRVRLIRTDDPYTDLQPGDCGTIDFVDDVGTVHCRWDKGGRLGLTAHGGDRWMLLPSDGE